MDERHDIDYDGWDEDGHYTRGMIEEEYWEDYEDEDDDYEHQYAPIQGNWDLDDYENFSASQKKVRKIHSIKSVDIEKTKARKRIQKKRRTQTQAREKQRQEYYHYAERAKKDFDEENEDEIPE